MCVCVCMWLPQSSMMKRKMNEARRDRAGWSAVRCSYIRELNTHGGDKAELLLLLLLLSRLLHLVVWFPCCISLADARPSRRSREVI